MKKMKKIGIFIALGIAIASCKNEKKTDVQIEKTLETTTHQQVPNESSSALFSNFNWENIPLSKAEIGIFPYLTAPEEYIVTNGNRDASKNGMTVFHDFNKLIMYDGGSFFNAEGKKAELSFDIAEGRTKWNQYKFDQSVEKYLESIGAKQIFKGQIPIEKLDELNKVDNMTVYNFIQGDPWNSDPVRHYALNHGNGKIVFQVWSNSAQGEVGVVELDGFKQTIKMPAADEMKNEIEKTGKAVLNINFDTGKATLKPDGQKVVDEIWLLLNDNPSLNLSIEGHTDNTGSAEHNYILSTNRTNTVMYALAAKGIAIERLKTKGFGADKPLVANDSEENKTKNRRVELVKF